MMNGNAQGRSSRWVVFLQALMGAAAYAGFVLPYTRRVHGLARLRPPARYLFVANHVSLLDTIFLGGLCWRAGCYPILTLGDKEVWHASRIKRLVSRPIGFLIERGKQNPGRIEELQEFARAGADFHLVVFPEGTRGNGIAVAPAQPGIYYIAQAARLPMVPVFFENMQLVSTKAGRFHPLGGLRRVEVHFGEPIAPAQYADLPREEFLALVRRSIIAARAHPPAEH